MVCLIYGVPKSSGEKLLHIKPLFKIVLHGNISETDRNVCWSKEAGTDVISVSPFLFVLLWT